MDWLDGAARLMIVSDLDFTMVDHLDPETLTFLSIFDNRWTEIQPEIDQRPHKVSFYVEKDKAMKVMKDLAQCLEKYGLDVKIVYNSGIALDVLPRCAGKGQALAYLLKKFEAEGCVPSSTLVCGDSGKEELLEWYSENAKNSHQITHATERCAAGIIQAIGTFNVGPNVSSDGYTDFLKCIEEICNPGHEVVKFYLFSERWRRLDVERSDHFINNLRLLFISSKKQK